jgi:hypothetical protein
MQVTRRGVAPPFSKELIYLSPDLPELNKIENYRAILKRYIRRFRCFFLLLKTLFSLFLTLTRVRLILLLDKQRFRSFFL